MLRKAGLRLRVSHLHAPAPARLGMKSQTDMLNAGLAVLAGTDTFSGWLMNQAGALDADLEIDV